MSDTKTEQSDEMYTFEEAADVMKATIERKRAEIEAMKKKGARLKNQERIDCNNALIGYLESDIDSYLTVIADMLDDDSYTEGVDMDSEPVEAPAHYNDYLDGLSADDLENELEAESLRAEYCDGIVEDMCLQIGEDALSKKKMVKALLEDPYALEQIGEIIFYDDYLYDLFKTISAEKKDGSGKKKKKKKV